MRPDATGGGDARVFRFQLGVEGASHADATRTGPAEVLVRAGLYSNPRSLFLPHRPQRWSHWPLLVPLAGGRGRRANWPALRLISVGLRRLHSAGARSASARRSGKILPIIPSVRNLAWKRANAVARCTAPSTTDRSVSGCFRVSRKSRPCLISASTEDGEAGRGCRWWREAKLEPDHRDFCKDVRDVREAYLCSFPGLSITFSRSLALSLSNQPHRF
jgi:hypothetical protein